MILEFGRYEGMDTSDTRIPDSYMKWLANRGSYSEPGNRFNTTWKVPITVSILARREMEKRGYKHNGYDWERNI